MVVYATHVSIPELVSKAVVQYLPGSKELKAGIRRYKYYDALSITNSSESSLTLYIDYSKTYPVPPGVTINVENVKYESFSVINEDDSITVIADSVEVICKAGGVL